MGIGTEYKEIATHRHLFPFPFMREGWVGVRRAVGAR